MEVELIERGILVGTVERKFTIHDDEKEYAMKQFLAVVDDAKKRQQQLGTDSETGAIS
jgi:hypothetical protein